LNKARVGCESTIRSVVREPVRPLLAAHIDPVHAIVEPITHRPQREPRCDDGRGDPVCADVNVETVA
jgi:hypothetical protein